MREPGAFAVRGTVVDAPVLGRVRVRPEALVLVDANGTIIDVLEPHDPAYDVRYDDLRRRGRLTELRPGQYLLPGLVDLHIHAPQWPQMGPTWVLRQTCIGR
jgi:guanine deaminase